ncbi:MAG: hypothetical protein MJZ35_09820 [Bacteroidaceae bacterium]|nr:hypothetical protein [Bacteroidaceae bacterium]
MKIKNILPIAIMVLLPFGGGWMGMTSCVSDDTTLPTRPLSEINIDGGIEALYNINKNETLRIKPALSQTNQPKTVTYTWEVDQQVYSHEEEFTYPAKELGTFQCRLIVENEDGKTFFPFTVNVNSPYEEGIALLSQQPDGTSMLSFMLTPSNGGPRSFTTGDCFSVNNPDLTFSPRCIDMVQSSGSLILACQGALPSASGAAQPVASSPSPGNGAAPTIYYLNEKTLVAENVVPVTEYDDFVPTRLVIPSVGASGVAYPILCENGSVYEFSTTEGAISKPTNFRYKYAQTCLAHDDGGAGWSFDLVFWDKEKGDLCDLYSGYGPYYCSTKYLLVRDSVNAQTNYFANNDIVKIVGIDLTAKQKRTDKSEMLVLTKNAFLTRKTILSTGFWEYDASAGAAKLWDNGGTSTACIGTNIINEQTPCVANKTYYSLLFGDKNQVRRWNYATSQSLDKADVLQTFGSDRAIVTDLVLSADHLTTYVAFYEPDQTGLNGSVYVISTDTGEILERHDNVCYRPVKMIYKKK